MLKRTAFSPGTVVAMYDMVGGKRKNNKYKKRVRDLVRKNKIPMDE